MKSEEDKSVSDRINVALNNDSKEALHILQERTDLKKVDLVNRALVVYEFIDAQLRAGNTIIIRDSEGTDQIIKLLF